MCFIDPSLTLARPYLNAACAHFTKKELAQELYELQVFMKVTAQTGALCCCSPRPLQDHTRAAMTCVNLFLAARNYEDRIRYLKRAIMHFESALAQRVQQRAAQRKNMQVC